MANTSKSRGLTVAPAAGTVVRNPRYAGLFVVTAREPRDGYGFCVRGQDDPDNGLHDFPVCLRDGWQVAE